MKTDGSSMQMIEQSYDSGYDDLVRDLSSVSQEALDWKITPDAVTIGSSVLHVLGYEHMLVSALRGIDVHTLRYLSDWHQYELGFQKELGMPVPQGAPLAHYLSMIEARRADTRRFFAEDALQSLAGETRFYKDGQEFKEKALRMEPNVALITSIICHVRYHRGQITLLKYLFSVAHSLTFVRS